MYAPVFVKLAVFRSYQRIDKFRLYLVIRNIRAALYKKIIQQLAIRTNDARGKLLWRIFQLLQRRKTVGDQNSVFLIQDGIAREQLVQLGLLEGDYIQVKNGVIDGQRVATSNLAQLTDGVFVRQ